MLNSRLIIWDFDGVLVDSLKECIIVLKIGIELLKNQEDLKDKKIFIENFTNHFDVNLFNKMKTLRPFIINGQDYIWQYLNLDKFSKSFNSYSDYKKVFDEIFDFKKDKIYEETFYKARKILQNTILNDYYKLFIPYQGAINALRDSLAINTNYICSARDVQAIKYIIKLYNIKLSEKFIYAKGKNDDPINRFSKDKQINLILKKENQFNNNFTLIEDQLTLPLQLLKKFSKMKIIYAKYGYGIDEECPKLKSKSILSIEKDEEIFNLVLNKK